MLSRAILRRRLLAPHRPRTFALRRRLLLPHRPRTFALRRRLLLSFAPAVTVPLHARASSPRKGSAPLLAVKTFLQGYFALCFVLK